MTKPKLLITGVAGYIASQLTLELLKTGRYDIRGSVQRIDCEADLGPLKKAYGDLYNDLELVKADLLDKDSLIKACEGVDYILHTASPLPLGAIKDEDDIIQPALQGMKSMMEGARANKVKRFVYLSSIAAISYKEKYQEVYDHNDWSEMPACTAYEKSKTLAEKEAWKFIGELPEDESIEFCTINPGLVLGPTIKTQPFTSANLFKAVMLGQIPKAPKVQIPISDIRDVVDGMIKALETPEAPGNRFIVVNDSAWFKELGETIAKAYPDYSPTIEEQSEEECMPHDKKNWGKLFRVDDSKTKEILKLNYKTVEECFLDMAASLIEVGYVEDKRTQKN